MRRARGGVAVAVGALLLGALSIGVLALSGCTAGGSSGSTGTLQGGAPQGGVRQVEPQPGTAQDASGSGAAKGAASDPNALDAQAQNRSVITTGTVSLTVEAPVTAASDATRIVDSAGGRVDAMTEQPGTPGQRASATLTLRIPSAKLDATLAELKKLGTVNSVTTSAQDVTTQVKDVNARITALQTSVNRLLELMSKATSTADLIAIESSLTQRQADLDSLISQQNYLKDQVSLATITLELHAPGTVAAAGPDNFFSGLAAGWNALLVAGGAFLVFLGVALPWLVLIAVIGGIVRGGIRLAGRGRRAKSQTPPAED
ncbi:MAG: DUF4349 domain-containing protein [Microbacteriaceae bacterium]|nr:MAG: DUF4349 domain-containing protein [Microbacteriaceae bacterium]